MRKKLRKFWDRFGYLCVLLLCFGMIGTTAYLTRRPAGTVDPPEVTRYALPTPTPSPRSVSVEVTIEPTATQPPFLLPAGSKTGMGFAQEAVVYNKTLGEWATHDGVDFLGQEGDAVRAVESGTVTRVWEDPLMGHCVEITHRGGYISRYCSLSTEGMVSAEDAVSRGQVIGTMGISASSECEEGPHLHFELWRLKAAQDPMNFLRDDA